MNEPDAIELADLRGAWTRMEAHVDARIDADVKRITAATDALVEAHSRTLVRRAMTPPIIDLVVAGAGWLLAANGLFHVGPATFSVCLAIVLGCLTALIGSSALQIATLARVDVAAPVVATQRQLGRARAHRIREWRWVLLWSPVLWTPFLVVAVELPLAWLSDGVAPGIFGAGYVFASLLIGVVLSLGLCWLSDRIADRFGDTPFVRGFVDDLAGRRLTAALEFVQRLDRFEHDEPIT